MSKLILASGSPRRKELLAAAGIDFEIVIPDVDETPLKKETPAAMVKRLSLAKAKVIAGRSGESRVVLAADTTVVSPTGKILGKPVTIEEARKMIHQIQGKTHEVLTGYALVKVVDGKIRKSISRVIKTQVTIKKMNRAQIEAYIARGESMDKAGAYAAQGFGMVLIEKIRGSYTNVVGLPMVEVEKDLAGFLNERPTRHPQSNQSGS